MKKPKQKRNDVIEKFESIVAKMLVGHNWHGHWNTAVAPYLREIEKLLPKSITKRATK